MDLSNVNPSLARGHKEVRRSTGHIMVTTRYTNQRVCIQIESKSLSCPTPENIENLSSASRRCLFGHEPVSTVVLSVCVCFLPIHSGHQVRWTYRPGSHRRKVAQDFSSTFFLRCVPYFFSREGFSNSFPSSTVRSNFVY